MISLLPSSAAPVVLSALILAACQESPLTPSATDPAVSLAPAGQVAFTGGACEQSGGSPGSVIGTPSRVTHVRGDVRDYTITSTDTRLVGTLRSTRAINAIADDVAQERATMVLSPTDYPGDTWEIVTVFRTRPYTAGRIGRGTGRGTGELSGLTLSWQWEEGVGLGCETTAFAITGTIRTAPGQ